MGVERFEPVVFTPGDSPDILGKFTPEQTLYLESQSWKINKLTTESNRQSQVYRDLLAHQGARPLPATLVDGIACNANHIYVLEERVQMLQTLVEDLYQRLYHVAGILQQSTPDSDV